MVPTEILLTQDQLDLIITMFLLACIYTAFSWLVPEINFFRWLVGILVLAFITWFIGFGIIELQEWLSQYYKIIIIGG